MSAINGRAGAPEVRTDIPVPERLRRRSGRKYEWATIPVGGSFEFDDVSPTAVIGSFAHHLAVGKYRVLHLGEGRYRFWRLG